MKYSCDRRPREIRVSHNEAVICKSHCHERSPISSFTGFYPPIAMQPRLTFALALAAGVARGRPVSAWISIIVDGYQPVAANRTIPADQSVRFENGGSFQVAAGVTLTIEGSLDGAPMQKIFGGAGTVLLGTRTPWVHPEWWGASAAPIAPEFRSLGTAARGLSSSSAGFPSHPVHPGRVLQQQAADQAAAYFFLNGRFCATFSPTTGAF